MSERKTSNPAEQENQQSIVEKFREILDRRPREYLWKDATNGSLRKIEEDNIVALYEGKEGEFLRAITLQTERIKKALLVPSTVLYGEYISDCKPKTTGEQLRNIVEKDGEPSKILYMRTDWENIEEIIKSDSFRGEFPFDEILGDLGLKKE